MPTPEETNQPSKPLTDYTDAELRQELTDRAGPEVFPTPEKSRVRAQLDIAMEVLIGLHARIEVTGKCPLCGELIGSHRRYDCPASLVRRFLGDPTSAIDDRLHNGIPRTQAQLDIAMEAIERLCENIEDGGECSLCGEVFDDPSDGGHDCPAPFAREFLDNPTSAAEGLLRVEQNKRGPS